jgi:hypothetical protein
MSTANDKKICRMRFGRIRDDLFDVAGRKADGSAYISGTFNFLNPGANPAFASGLSVFHSMHKNREDPRSLDKDAANFTV